MGGLNAHQERGGGDRGATGVHLAAEFRAPAHQRKSRPRNRPALGAGTPSPRRPSNSASQGQGRGVVWVNSLKRPGYSPGWCTLLTTTTLRSQRVEPSPLWLETFRKHLIRRGTTQIFRVRWWGQRSRAAAKQQATAPELATAGKPGGCHHQSFPVRSTGSLPLHSAAPGSRAQDNYSAHLTEQLRSANVLEGPVDSFSKRGIK